MRTPRKAGAREGISVHVPNPQGEAYADHTGRQADEGDGRLSDDPARYALDLHPRAERKGEIDEPEDLARNEQRR